MNNWSVSFETLQKELEYWLTKVVAGDRVIVTIRGEPSAVLMEYKQDAPPDERGEI